MRIEEFMQKLIGVEQATEILNLSTERVCQLLKAKRLPGRLVANGWIMYEPVIRKIAKRRKKWHKQPLS